MSLISSILQYAVAVISGTGALLLAYLRMSVIPHLPAFVADASAQVRSLDFCIIFLYLCTLLSSAMLTSSRITSSRK